MTSAKGGAPAEVMVPIRPDATPAQTTLRPVGRSCQPARLKATAASSSKPKATDMACADTCTSRATASTAPTTRPARAWPAARQSIWLASRTAASRASGKLSANKGPGTSCGKNSAASGADSMAKPMPLTPCRQAATSTVKPMATWACGAQGVASTCWAQAGVTVAAQRSA